MGFGFSCNKEKSGDKLNKEDDIKIFTHMIIIVRDYLCSLPNNNNNSNSICQNNLSNEMKIKNNEFLKLIKEYKFEGDSINGKSINTIIDLNNDYFIVTIGERGKIILNKKNYEVISYKKNHGFYVNSKVNSFLISNNENEGTLWYSAFDLNNLIQIEIYKFEIHKSGFLNLLKFLKIKLLLLLEIILLKFRN